jgi:CCR4-NOT transcription complex subunit 6
MQRQDFKKTDDMFNRVLGKDHIAVICLFENVHTGTRFIIANAHIHWDPAYRDVKVVQVALLVEEVEKLASSFARYPPPKVLSGAGHFSDLISEGSEEDGNEGSLADLSSPHSSPPHSASSAAPTGASTSFPRYPPIYTDGTKIPLIICGDFNSVPVSGVYEFLSMGSLPSNHPDFMSHTYGRYTSEGIRHRLGLKSAYAGLSEHERGVGEGEMMSAKAGTESGEGGDVPLTNYTPSFRGVIDYVFYSAANLSVNKVLGGVDRAYLDTVVGFPNSHFPSE